ncbi:MAG: hypothetical protein ABI120_24725 [Gemmatimonadaceae bacterium]
MNRLSPIIIAIAALGSTSLEAQSAPEQTVLQWTIPVSPDSITALADSTVPILVAARPVGLLAIRAVDEHLFFQDTTRRKAVRYSEWYGRRLRVHRYGSYAMLPLFVTQFVLGNKLINQKNEQYAGTRTTPIDQNLRSTHKVVAGAVGALFVVNTTTGLWNLFASRHTIEGRKLRTVHALTMLAADAGFAYTGYLSSQAVDHGPAEARKHRNVAVASFSIATAGASLMWFRRD